MAFDAQICALTIFCEASSSSQDERLAVAHVIRNRVASKRWSTTPSGVCTDYMQFSSWNGDHKSRQNLLRGMNTPDADPVMRACSLAWLSSGNTFDPTKGATHYTDMSISPPSWTDGAEMTLQTEHFRFYANVK